MGGGPVPRWRGPVPRWCGYILSLFVLLSLFLLLSHGLCHLFCKGVIVGSLSLVFSMQFCILFRLLGIGWVASHRQVEIDMDYVWMPMLVSRNIMYNVNQQQAKVFALKLYQPLTGQLVLMQLKVGWCCMLDHELCLDFSADLLTTTSTAKKLQTYMTTQKQL